MREHPKQGRHQGGHEPHRGEGLGRDEGRGGKARRGEARHLLLDALRDGPKHGYEIIKTLEERSGGRYAPSPGTVYPTLQLLEDLGFVGAAQDAERRIYHLTEKGRAEMEARVEEIQTFWARLAQPEVSPAEQAEVDFLGEELRFLEQTVWRVARARVPGDLETIRRVRLALEQCRNEVRRIVTEPV